MNTVVINPLFVSIVTGSNKITRNPIYEIPICCICFEKVQENRHQCTVCSHFTHIKCIKKWKKTSKKKTCPTCRTKIKLKR